MNKKIVIYLGSLLALIIIVIVFIIYLNAKNKTPGQQTDKQQDVVQQDQDQAQQDSKQQQNQQPQSRITRVSDEPVIAPVLNNTADAYWYFTADGSVYKVNLAKGLKQEFLVSEKNPTAEGIWPSTGSDFILVSGIGKDRTFRYYSSESKEFINYPANFRGVDFGPGAKTIFYNWVKDAKSVLSSGDVLNTEFQNILDLPEAGLAIKASPSGKAVLAYNKDDNQNGKLYLVLLDAKKVVTLKTNLDNSAIWSPDGKHFAYNRDPAGDRSNTNLWLGDSAAPTDVDLGLNTTVAKVAFDSSGANLYAAVLDAQTNSDKIWKINLSTMQKTLVLEAKPTDSPNQISAINLLVSPDSANIYFMNSDRYLYGYHIGD